MAKYRLKTEELEVEAIQYNDDPEVAEKFLGRKLESAGQINILGGGPGVIIGNEACVKGNWIIKTSKGVRLMDALRFALLYGEGK
jgi:hypothetical protein